MYIHVHTEKEKGEGKRERGRRGRRKGERERETDKQRGREGVREGGRRRLGLKWRQTLSGLQEKGIIEKAEMEWLGQKNSNSGRALTSFTGKLLLFSPNLPLQRCKQPLK